MLSPSTPLLKSDDKPAQVIAGDVGYIPGFRANEVSKVADTGDNPLNGFGALTLGTGAGTVSGQRVRDFHRLKFLMLTAYGMR